MIVRISSVASALFAVTTLYDTNVIVFATTQQVKNGCFSYSHAKGGEGIDEESGGSSSNDGARPMQGDEALDNLRAHPQWQA